MISVNKKLIKRYWIFISFWYDLTMQKINLPNYENIPDVGLYLDQVTKYINSYLNEEYALTSNMITNYVKQKIVPKGYKKTYSRGHIAQFMLIAYFKTVLSMEQIKIIFTYYLKKYSIEEFYNIFVNTSKEEKILEALYLNILSKEDIDSMISSLVL